MSSLPSGLSGRLRKELDSFSKCPPPGVSCVLRTLDTLDASIQASKGTPYEGGIFQLEVGLPPDYPFKPPLVRFLTPIFHPNIDTGGRICLEILQPPPTGRYTCTCSIATILLAIQQLLNQPNFSDPLMPEVAQVLLDNPDEFMRIAREWTEKYAKK